MEIPQAMVIFAMLLLLLNGLATFLREVRRVRRQPHKTKSNRKVTHVY
jgi:hypothetical protein